LRDWFVAHSPWRDPSSAGSFDDEDEIDDDGTGWLDTQAGHGTFIAGIVRRVCPDADLRIDGVLSSFGDGDDWTVASGIQRTLDRLEASSERPDVVVMSLGCYTADDEEPPLSTAIRRLLGDVLVVASAGNSASPRPSYPAFMPDVIAVGALEPAGRAWFSNFGGWVDACAPGVDVVSTFFMEHDEGDGADARAFRGWAAWSGTSFSAPKVAAAIAQEMYLTGSTAGEAWRRLSSWRRLRAPDLGIVFNIL
jgi:subtilisin family serine protease